MSALRRTLVAAGSVLDQHTLGRRRFARPCALAFAMCAKVELRSISCERGWRSRLSETGFRIARIEPSQRERARRAEVASRNCGNCGNCGCEDENIPTSEDRRPKIDRPIRVIGSEGLDSVGAIGCFYRTILPFEESKGCARSMTKGERGRNRKMDHHRKRRRGAVRRCQCRASRSDDISA